MRFIGMQEDMSKLRNKMGINLYPKEGVFFMLMYLKGREIRQF
jgi:hypothetical protein